MLKLCTAAGLLGLAGCKAAVLDPAGPIGAAEKTILLNALVIMLAMVIPTILAIFGFAWWYRASNQRARYRPDWAYSGRIEMITWSIPGMVIMFLGGMTWIGSHELDPAKRLDSPNTPIEIQAVSLDWKWLFIYPSQGIATVNQITVPAGVPLHFTLTSASVMNTFFVPRLGSMIYTMNGMSDELYLQADAPGAYYGRSAHYSGDGFSDMQFTLTAVPADQFDAWAQKVHGAGGALDPAAYADLSKQTAKVPPKTYGSVTPDLYQMIVSQKLPPGPGPDEGKPATNVSPRAQGDDAR